MDPTDIIVGFVLNGVLILIFRGIIQAAHDREMSRMQAENQRDLAGLSAQLERVTKMQMTRFANLHQRRAEVIAELYKLLAMAESKLKYAHFPMPYIGKEDLPGSERAMRRIRPTYEAVSSLLEFYSQNKIFLTPAQVSMMDGIVDILDNLRASVMMRELQRESPPAEQDTREFAETWTKQKLDDALAAYQEIYPNLKQDLEADFRRILGFQIELES